MLLLFGKGSSQKPLPKTLRAQALTALTSNVGLLWMDGWMDLLSGTGVATALRNVQWPKPFHTPAQPLRLGWLFQRTKPLQGYDC